VPFLEFPVELRTVVYTTNAIESLNARFRRAVRHRGQFPNEQAALKVLYLVATERGGSGPTPAGGSMPGSPSSTRSPSTTATASRPPADHEAITPGYTTNRTVPLVAGLRDRPGRGPFVADVGGDRHRDSTSSFDQRNRLSELLGRRSARLTLSYCRSLAVTRTDQGSYVRRIACSWLSARR
jgi:Transposase, Mutator family